MTLTEALADCIERLERGETTQSCLIHYREHAAELAPLLQALDAAKNAPPLRMPSGAFTRGRTALFEAAQSKQRAGRAHVPSAASRAAYPENTSHPTMTRTGPASGPRRRPTFQPLRLLHATTGLLVALFLLLGGFTLARSISTSLPGDHLYTVKRAAESVQGSLMAAAGERAVWHARQVERRLRESLILEARGLGIDPQLAAHVELDLHLAIDASAELTPTERHSFLLAWLEGLYALEDGAAQDAPATATLHRTIRAIERAAATAAAPTATLLVPTPTAPPTETATISPTATDTATPLPSATPTETATPTKTPVPATPTLRPSATPTPLPTPQVETPQPTRSGGGSSGDDSKEERRPTQVPTAPPTAPPQPTDTPSAPTPTPVDATPTTDPSLTPTTDVTQLPTPETPPTPDITLTPPVPDTLTPAATDEPVASTTPDPGTITPEPTGDAEETPTPNAGEESPTPETGGGDGLASPPQPTEENGPANP